MTTQIRVRWSELDVYEATLTIDADVPEGADWRDHIEPDDIHEEIGMFNAADMLTMATGEFDREIHRVTVIAAETNNDQTEVGS